MGKIEETKKATAEKNEEITGEPLLGPAGFDKLRSLLDEGYKLIIFNDDKDGDCINSNGNEGAKVANPMPTGRFFRDRRTTNLRGFCALFGKGKPYIVFKDDETGLYLKHEIAEIVDGNVKLTEPNDIWDVILLQGKEETKK